MKAISTFLAAVFFVSALLIPSHSLAHLWETIQHPLEHRGVESVYCWQEIGGNKGPDTNDQNKNYARCHIDPNDDQIGSTFTGVLEKAAKRNNCIHMLAW